MHATSVMACCGDWSLSGKLSRLVAIYSSLQCDHNQAFGGSLINRSRAVRSSRWERSQFPHRLRFGPYQQGGTHGTGERESRRNPQHGAVTSHERFINRFARERVM